MLGPRALSSVGVVLVGVLPALFGPWGVAAAFTVLGGIALHELVAMFAHVNQQVMWGIAAPTLIVALVAGAAGRPGWAFSALIALAVFGPAFALIFRSSLEGTLATWVATTFASLVLALPLYHITRVRAIGGETFGAGRWLTHLERSLGFGGTARGLAWFLLALVTVWLTDVGAYTFGRLFGRHAMTPILSPKKTWEGFAGGILCGLGTALLTNWAFGIGMRGVIAAGAGIIIALVATAGDLAESLIKRQTGVKDSGTLIPGHGGVLDRLDSQLFVFVAVYYIALAVG